MFRLVHALKPSMGASPHSFGRISHQVRFASTVTIDFDIPFATHKCESPALHTTTTKEELLRYYRELAIMRRMELACDQLYKSKEIRGFCHLYDGQEAIALGVEEAVTFNDSLITAYRNHCQQYMRGDTVESIIAELMGRRTGCSKGKGGSMHLYRRKSNYFGGNGIVGAQVPVGVGLAFEHKYNNDGGVAISMFGDGASNQGQIFEALNMASLWKLPAIIICENNRYGMGTSQERSSASTDYYTRGDYVPGIRMDGQCVFTVREGMKFAAQHCRDGHGPIYVEMDTYRYHGHSMSDPGVTYRSRDEITGMRNSRDPILKVKQKLLAFDFSTEEELKAIDKQIRKDVDASVAKAKSTPFPEATELVSDVYADTSIPIRGVESTQWY